MDEKYLAQGLINATGDELRLVYALLMETKMLDLLVAKAKNTFLNKDIDHFEENLKKEIERLQIYSDEELQLQLFLYVQEQLDLVGAHYNIRTEIEYKCGEIVEKAHYMQKKQDKEYGKFIEGRDENYSVLLVLYQMQKIFESFDEKMGELSEAQTESLVNQIEQYIQSLPDEKQRQIKEKLKIDELTNKTIRQILLTQGSAIVMAIVVEVAGFAAFTTLTSAIAATAGFFGITLPFGAYIFATSALSFLTGPIGLALIAVGGGAILTYQNKKVRKSMIPIGIVQLLLPVIIEGEQQTNFQPFINEWMKGYEEQERIIHQLDFIQHSKADLAQEHDDYEKEKVELYQQLNLKSTLFNHQICELKNTIPFIAENEMTVMYKALTTDMNRLAKEKTELLLEIARNKLQKGFFNAMKNVFSNASLQSSIKGIEAQYEKKELERAHEIIKMKPAHLRGICIEAEGLSHDIASINTSIVENFSNISDVKSRIACMEIDIKKYQDELKQHQKKWYGLKDIE
ncbi:hypothetical protein [Lysinibacillus sp. LZ02]|uniref:hypothetical protein n=1 Tax=Lysinibacillus sp. LZ02 TaxID=3420668 RepID=UPI003D3654B1